MKARESLIYFFYGERGEAGWGYGSASFDLEALAGMTPHQFFDRCLWPALLAAAQSARIEVPNHPRPDGIDASRPTWVN